MLIMKKLLLFVLFLSAALLLDAKKPKYLTFVDSNVERIALNAGDQNRDGKLSEEEAAAIEELNLTAYRINMFTVGSYEDIAKLPNLKIITLGESSLETVDLSRNLKLERIVIQSDDLKVLIINVMTKPHILFPNRAGEVTVKRVLDENDPNAIWYM